MPEEDFEFTPARRRAALENLKKAWAARKAEEEPETTVPAAEEQFFAPCKTCGAALSVDPKAGEKQSLHCSNCNRRSFIDWDKDVEKA